MSESHRKTRGHAACRWVFPCSRGAETIEKSCLSSCLRSMWRLKGDMARGHDDGTWVMVREGEKLRKGEMVRIHGKGNGDGTC